MALSFFFGDEFGSLTPFLGDAVASVLFAGLFTLWHLHTAILSGTSIVGGMPNSPVDCANAGNSMPPRGSVV